MTYDMITEQSISEMSEQDKALAIYALKRRAIDGGWSIGTKHGEFIEGAGNTWVATIGISGYPNLFVGRDDTSELSAIMKAFDSVKEAIAK